MEMFVVEALGPTELLPCDACGDNSKSARGIVRGGGGETAYLVHWGDGRLDEHGAHFDLLMARNPESFAVAVAFLAADEPGFMVIDASQRQTWSGFPTPVRLLSREEVITTPLAEIVYAIIDAIWLQDPRLRELQGDAA
jgi:hypothetical protein